MRIEQKPSPNHTMRRGGAQPSLIILHYTGMKTAAEALARLCDPAAEVSAHYMVDEDGTITQLVDDKHRAWHAGRSYWDGEIDINSHSIGIEIVNPGHEFGYRPFPEAQIAAVTQLCRNLMARYKIPAANVLAHSDIAPARKADPGEMFPWARLAAEGVGVWPAPDEMDDSAAPDLMANQDILHALLCGLGYDPQATFRDVMTAFHRHYYPEKFADGVDSAQPCKQGVARVLALVRARHNRKT